MEPRLTANAPDEYDRPGEARASLQQADARVRLALEAASIGTWDLDLSNHRMFWDPRCKAIFGLPPDVPVTYETFLALLHPDDRDRVMQVSRGCLDPAGTGDYDIEFRVQAADGTIRWVQTRGRVVFDGAGAARRPVHVVGTALDITERRQATEDQAFLLELGGVLRRLDDADALIATGLRLLRTYLRAAQSAFVEIDEAGQAAAVHQEHRPGATPATPLVGPYTDETLDPILKAHRAGMMFVCDDTARDPRTAALQSAYAAIAVRSLVSAPFLRHGRPVVALQVVDTAPRAWAAREGALVQAAVERIWPAWEAARALAAERSARDAAERTAERMRRLQETTEMLSNVHTAEEAARVMVQQSIADLGAATAAVVLLRPDQRTAEVAAEVAAAAGSPSAPSAAPRAIAIDAPSPESEAIRTGRPVLIEPSTGESSHEGTAERACAGIAVPLVLEGTAMGALVLRFGEARPLLRDDVDFVVALGRIGAQALGRAALNAAAERSRAEAEAAREQAEAANRAKSDFLAIMSHELRTPLNAIAGYTELMEAGVRGTFPEAYREYVRRIKASQMHLLGLIDRVLSFAKIEAGHVDYDIRPIAAAEVLAAVELMITPLAASRGLICQWEPCERDVVALADPGKMQQILLNLLSNAVKYTRRGGRITVRTETSDEPPAVVVRVADTGIGIAPEKLPGIFDPFMQVDNRLTRTSDGVGLGLAISRDLARGMGGDLAAESTPGVGSMFTLTLRRA